MSRIKKIEDIDSIIIHWSESIVINVELGCDDNSDIEKEVTPEKAEALIRKASTNISAGYDKTSMTVKLKDGSVWATESKFYICRGDSDLLSVLNKGE